MHRYVHTQICTREPIGTSFTGLSNFLGHQVMFPEPDEKISHSAPVNKAMSFPESSQGLIARQNKFFKTFLPFNFIKCLTFNNIS